MADMISQYLASRGAAGSADNANRVRSFYASNPDLLDRRAMGLPGGLDDNSAVLDATLDKHIAESMPTAPAPAPQAGREEIPPPSRAAPAVRGPKEVGGTATTVAPQYDPNQNMGALPPRNASTSRDPEYGSVQGNDPQASSMGGDIGKWLLGLLGAGAGAYGISKAGKNGAPSASSTGALPGMTPNAPGGIPMDSAPPGVGPNAPAPYGTDTPVTRGNPKGGTAVPVTEGDPDAAAKRALVEQQIQEENDAMARKMMDQERVLRSQRNAEETARAARRVTGRR